MGFWGLSPLYGDQTLPPGNRRKTQSPKQRKVEVNEVNSSWSISSLYFSLCFALFLSPDLLNFYLVLLMLCLTLRTSLSLRATMEVVGIIETLLYYILETL